MRNKTAKRGRPSVTGLTPAQIACLQAVVVLLEKHGIPPSVNELARYLTLTPPTAHAHLKQLIKKGYLTRSAGKARGLRVLREWIKKPKDLVQVPILGEVIAGQPLWSEEHFEGELAVEGNLIRQGKYFALRVKGDSMRDAGILAGDYVIVRQQPIAESGELVVATVEGEATLKRLMIHSDGRVLLVPANSRYRPIDVTLNRTFQLLGKVIATSKLQKELK